jgi:hypothetical protein
MRRLKAEKEAAARYLEDLTESARLADAQRKKPSEQKSGKAKIKRRSN